MKKIILAAILPLFAIWGCDNTTIVDHAYEGTINQNTNVTGPSVDEAVDLGLSVKWAPYNIGATKPSDFGNYYAYGETEPKENYSSGNYTAPANKNTFGNIISTQSDAATAEWGANWRMPSKEEIEELKQCRWETIEDNGVKGVKITGKNGNSIFLPAAGIITESKLFEHNSKGFYRSGDNQSSKLEYFNIPEEKFYGCCIRPVLAIAGEQAKEISIPQESEAIDLGLSVKWAPYNIGASEAWEYGNYYAFGELEPKNLYLKNNYVKPVEFNCEGSIETSNSDISTVKWGKQWRMPSASEYNELFELCEVKLITIKDNMVFEITGPNGNKLHLPLNGYCDDYKIFDKGISGGTYYWNSNYSGEDDVAYRGFAVRPVLNEPIKQNNDFPVPTKEESVNLGLSVNWAPYNVGASSSTENGNYYAWGEIEYKDYYCEHNYTAPAELNADGGISGTQYDVAHMKWGNGWRMPTAEEVAELWMNCTWKEENRDGIDGISITAFNGNSIFLPVSGYIDYRRKNSSTKGFYRLGSNNPADINYFNIDEKFLGAVVRPVIDNDNNEIPDAGTENLIKVSINNFTHTNYTKNHWGGVYTDRLEIGGDFTLSINNKKDDVIEYGIYLYRNRVRFAKIKSEKGVSYSFDLLSINMGSEKSISSEANSDNLPDNSSYDENTININFAACQDDFEYIYNNGAYIANLGGSYKYATYYITEDGREIIGNKLYPVNIEYKLEDTPYVVVENIHENGPVEDHNNFMSLPYGWEMTTHGSLFIDTLYTVNVICTFTNINDPESYNIIEVKRSGTHTIYEGKLGIGTSYLFSRNNDNYDIQYIEGAIRKGNELVTFKTKPMVFKRSNGSCTLTSPDIDGWPEKFDF